MKSDRIFFPFTQWVNPCSRLVKPSSRFVDHTHLPIEITLIRLQTKSHDLDHQNLHLLVLPFGDVQIGVFWIPQYGGVNPRYKFATNHPYLLGFIKKVVLE